MQNKRTTARNYKKTGIIQEHINNNIRNYIIITMIFLVRCDTWSIVYKQCK